MTDETKDAEFIQPPDDLSRKAPVTAGGVDLAAIEKAEALIANLQDDYLTWAEADATQLGRACDDLVNDPPDPEAAKKELFRVAHDMKGQGGSFGYDLITVVGDQLCRFVEGLEGTPTRAEAEVLRVHVETIRLILTRRMKGDGGRDANVLLDGLQRAIRKVST
ncbi:Hpt domain-containing protein [Roseospira visakhapatnamensis]|uniref:Chemotaxis protein histidine kinase CheA n=1 Tax=Roseospira visakhapatnamensis TaxID=390880 RepID=A0A7W6RDP6_9PROT|nr:Hpt domain-containing protein [Roseospira visakhapatnamensis]MBB4266161.1 chemotaxis protein histidine kinase CheA [Roseospira visakhapatnamensis]